MQRLVMLAITTIVLGAQLAATAAAGSPHAVDPASVTPPLNPSLTWSCSDTGAGPICMGTLDTSYQSEPIDMTCDGNPVYVTGSSSDRTTRWHLPDGRATKTISNLSSNDRFSLSPTGDGPSLVVRGHWNRHYTYPIPAIARPVCCPRSERCTSPPRRETAWSSTTSAESASRPAATSRRSTS